MGTLVAFSFTYAGIRVRDPDRSIDFDAKVRGMRLRKTHGEVAFLRSPRRRRRPELN